MVGFTFERRDWPRARREFAAAAAAAPRNDVLFYNLGLLFERNGLLAEALQAFRRSNDINPRHLANRARPRASDRIAEVLAEMERVATVERRLAQDQALSALEPGTAKYHRRLADLLEARGETTAARGHRLRALQTAGEPGRPHPGVTSP